MNKPVWIVQKEPQSEYTVSILRLLLPEYARIFGVKTMSNEECFVYNDTQATCPMLITNSAPISIRLAQPSLSFWAQTIFQLSHELCHYAIRQSKTDKSVTLAWFEEIICEAMSLYALQWASEHWEKCELYSFNPGFRDSIKDYLQMELEKNGNGDFQKCTTIELLKQYDANQSRDSHRDERNRLYYEIDKDPSLCRCFCDYQRYLDSNGVTINFEEWEKYEANPLVRFLHSLQPCPRELT